MLHLQYAAESLDFGGVDNKYTTLASCDGSVVLPKIGLKELDLSKNSLSSHVAAALANALRAFKGGLQVANESTYSIND